MTIEEMRAEATEALTSVEGAMTLERVREALLLLMERWEDREILGPSPAVQVTFDGDRFTVEGFMAMPDPRYAVGQITADIVRVLVDKYEGWRVHPNGHQPSWRGQAPDGLFWYVTPNIIMAEIEYLMPQWSGAGLIDEVPADHARKAFVVAMAQEAGKLRIDADLGLLSKNAIGVKFGFTVDLTTREFTVGMSEQ